VGYTLLIGTLSSNVEAVLAAIGHDGVMLGQASEVLKGTQVPPISPWRILFKSLAADSGTKR